MKTKQEKIKIGLNDRIILFKQLGFFLKSGTPLNDCLNLAAASLPFKNPRRRLLNRLQEDVAAGMSFYQSLGHHMALSVSLSAIIESGEGSGTLRQALERCGQELVKKDLNRKKILSALTYPAAIAVLAFALTGGMVFAIFPKIRPLLESMHTALPLPTRVLIFISDAPTHHGLIVLGITIILGISVAAAFKLKTFRLYITAVLNNLSIIVPVLNRIVKDQILSIFTGTMAVLINTGMPMPVGLERSRPSNMVYAEVIELVRFDVEAGSKISQALSRHPRLFPETMVQLIRAAESSGSLIETLSFLSDYFQNEYEELVKKWSSLLEPMLMVVMGFAVGFIALAMILPIYALSQTVGAIH